MFPMKSFRRVIMTNGQTEIAKVNTKTGSLSLSTDIWNRLPQAEKDYVLFHEAGHLVLQTTDEYAANKYAVGQFLKAGTFTNKELGNKIMVMRSILDKADGQTATFVADVVAGSASGIMQTLSVLGIGSKARIKEAEATAAANSIIYEAQAKAAASKSKSTQTIVLIAGVLVIVAVAIYFTLRKR